MKIIIGLVLLGVLVALGGAGLFMLRKGQSPADRDARMAKALAWRVGLSIALFMFVLVGWWMGWLKPGGVPLGG